VGGGWEAWWGYGELLIFMCVSCGRGPGILWFNAYPRRCSWATSARLAIGAAIGRVAVIVRQEVVTLVHGRGVRARALPSSSRASYKLTGKRISEWMAPIHHHFEL